MECEVTGNFVVWCVVTGWLSGLFWLLFAHAMADFALQSDAIAKGKNPNHKTDPPPGQKFIPCWPYYLTAHALIHGGFVGMFLGWQLGLAEAISHWVIDWFKCANKYGVKTDQALHMMCKVIWLSIFLSVR